MAYEKYQRLVQKLLERTDKNELQWKETASPETFQVSFSNYSLTLSEQTSGSGPSDFVVTIINSAGDLVDSFSDVLLDEGHGATYYRSMGELHQKARRQALGVDQAIDEILDDLEGSL